MTRHNGDARGGIAVREAALERPSDQAAIVSLIDAYARDAFGNGRPLEEEVKEALIPGLRRLSTTRVFLAFEGDAAIGIAVCFIGFSTFFARPLINIHDFAVLAPKRGRGAGRALLSAVERAACDMGCCKLTLEVQEHNHRARKVYAAAGFSQAVYQPHAGGGLFLSKRL